mgnify:CR=1 FL=1|tara:strand:+ start:44711 stop:44965 length:255 start_codon:yes stop_codon:yes gene_type:complete
MDFADWVRSAVAAIPKGSTRSYKYIARAAGSPRAYRAVGNILNKNRDPNVPCHRVIKSDGSLGGYYYGSRAKARKLKEEGYVSR